MRAGATIVSKPPQPPPLGSEPTQTRARVRDDPTRHTTGRSVGCRVWRAFSQRREEDAQRRREETDAPIRAEWRLKRLQVGHHSN
eukprot:909816-Prorocentrum_minimum.AAC.1